MEEEEDERKNRRPNLAAFSSLNARVVHSSLEEGYVRQQASSESADANTCSSISTAQYSDRSFISKTSTFSRSGTSSSSQEECEVAQATVTTGQFLAAARVETARSMESLRPSKDTSPARPASSCTSVRSHRSSFLTASERDVRESRGLPARRALSGEDMGTSAEKRRGLFASTDRRALQQLSLPPPERRLTILSPHSPMAVMTELQWPVPSGIRGRRKKGMVLPKLILPRTDSEASEVFIERLLQYYYYLRM
ncbi:uncharacterized protein LOC114249015 [Bombyx mandarina]|uniref:Uncharacterized protein n=2 Tax=Bombyx TaxID=7090 RepID=A0A8R2M665_BOMMO|nr:uncharacterized protein LOC114249015 [Bombyx mandarina]XP_037874958.1 uncharacterized protein LOC119630261 isoform X1 [Bombyx mori]